MKTLVLTFLICFGLAAQTPPKRLIMISIDGLMARTLRNAEKLGVRLPNLIEFRDRGATSQGLLGVFPTVTYPSHTTMVTGRYPADHGITSNTMFDPERTLNGAWYWYSEMIKAPTLWAAARAAGLKTGGVGWPVTAGALIDYNVPEYRAFRSLDDQLLFRALPTPGLIAEYEKAKGPIQFKGEHFDDILSGLAAYIIETRKPHLMLVHLIDLDHDQHGFGPESPQALRALENIDLAVGRLRQAVNTAGITAETRWIIVSDHGFFPVKNLFHADAFLTSLGLAADSDPRSWRVAVRTAGGSAAFVLKDPADKAAETLVLTRLKSLKEDGGSGIDRILESDELRRMKAWPDAFAAVSMSQGWATGGNRNGPWVTPSERTLGTHGYAPGPEALDCTFVVFGPGIAPRPLPRGDLIDVAPTAARLLGLSMSDLPGRDLLGETPRKTRD